MHNRQQTAQKILGDNDREGYTVPSRNLYPYQWNWDSGFVALGFATFDEPRAWQELESLFAAQWPSGMIPHIIFWKAISGYFPGPTVWQAGKFGAGVESSGISQPPVLATVMHLLYQSAKDKTLAKQKIKQLLPKLDHYHRWWHAARDPEQQGVIHITHPWESGRDNLPDWNDPASAIDTSKVASYQRTDTGLVDQEMRPTSTEYDQYIALVELGASVDWDNQKIFEKTQFWVADVATSAIMIRAERDLLALGKLFPNLLNRSDLEIRLNRINKGFDKFWNKGCNSFCSYNARTGKFSANPTSASFLCFYADTGSLEQRQAQLALLQKWTEKVEYLVPSYDPFGEEFDHVRYWCGPVWSVVNFMIGLGLSECGETAWAERIKQDTQRLIEKDGFYEYFSPVTGEGCGGDYFSWTAAIDLFWPTLSNST